jgi:hypothetical protein
MTCNVTIAMNPYMKRDVLKNGRCFLCGRLLWDHELFVRGDLPAGHAVASVVILDATTSLQAGRGVTDSPTYGARRTHRRNREGAVEQGVKG